METKTVKGFIIIQRDTGEMWDGHFYNTKRRAISEKERMQSTTYSGLKFLKVVAVSIAYKVL